MTRFWRDGFWRTSRTGYQHWVDGHWVERDDWDKASWSSSPAGRAYGRLGTLRALHSFTSTFINPNARCPVCGQDVFYYQNGRGSRVYFDELGPPWPKHPCTDRSTINCTETQPTARPDYQLRQIARLLTVAGLNFNQLFSTKYGTLPWQPVIVVRRISCRDFTILAVSVLGRNGWTNRVLKSARLPRAVRDGTALFVRGEKLAFFDLVRMIPTEFSIEKIRGIDRLVDELRS